MLRIEEKRLDRNAERSLSFLKDLFKDFHPRAFSVRLWDGTTWNAEPGETARFTLVLNHPGSLRAMLVPLNELTLGEAYIYDDFDIEGDIEAVFPVAWHLGERQWDLIKKLNIMGSLIRLPASEKRRNRRLRPEIPGQRRSLEHDGGAAAYHYDVSSDFFQNFLDENMIYSCAYFDSPDQELDAAQMLKLDHICRKLGLRQGERLLDIGCGWGGLMMHAAKKYGTSNLGINVCESQSEAARQRIEQARLSKSCRVELRDYREIEERETFDKVASIEMFEHVGQAMLPDFFRRVQRVLKPGGTCVLQGTVRTEGTPRRRGPSFDQSYIFPNGELLPITTILKIAEQEGFEVRDIESMREHYVLTLKHWKRRLEASARDAREVTDDVTYRIWRLFIAGSAFAFETGMLNVYQIILTKPDRGASRLPQTYTVQYYEEQ